MSTNVTFTDPTGVGPDVVLPIPEIDKALADHDNRLDHIPEVDPSYVDLGMQYRLARLE